MSNTYKIEVVDGSLVILIPDVAKAMKDAQPSKTGKSKVVATTHGFTNISTPGGTVSISLNAICR